jgi:plastocyanin
MHMRGRSLPAGLGLLSLLIGCGGSDTTGGPNPGGGNAVTVDNNFYSPASLSVAANTTVTWTWANGATSHSVTFNDGGPSSQTQGAGGTFQRAFPTAGTYPYHCVVHADMTGTVTVTAAGTTSGNGTGGSGMGGGGGGGYGP